MTKGETTINTNTPKAGSGRYRLQLFAAVVFTIACGIGTWLILAKTHNHPGPVEQTKITILMSMEMLRAWKEHTGKEIDHRTSSATLAGDANESTALILARAWMENLIRSLRSLPATSNRLAHLGKDEVGISHNGMWLIVDGWGRPLIYASDVSHSDAFTDDDFLPEHATPFFVSAGPDGLFGDVRDPQNKAAADNIYSYRFGLTRKHGE